MTPFLFSLVSQKLYSDHCLSRDGVAYLYISIFPNIIYLQFDLVLRRQQHSTDFRQLSFCEKRAARAVEANDEG